MLVKCHRCVRLLAAGLGAVLLCVFCHGVVSAAEEMPAMDFLEFIGEWETADGEWIDPLALKEVEESVNAETKAVSEEKSDEN